DEAFEAVGFDREPVLHVAAERRPRRADAVLIDIGQRLQVIGALHEVVVALAAPVAADLVHEFLAEAGRAARVRQRDDVALRRPQLWVPAEAPAVLPGALRAAVDEERDRPFFLGV